MSVFFLGCRRHRENLSLLAARRLPENSRAALTGHLAKCPACRQRLSELESVVGGLQAWQAYQAANEPSADFQFQLRQAFRNTAQDGATRPRPFSPPAWRARRFVLAYLATVWVLILFFNWDAPKVSEPVQAARTISAKEIIMALKATRDSSRHLSPQEYIAQPASPTPPHSRRRVLSGDDITV